MTKVSKNIKKLRTEKGLTQEDIAKELFVTRQTVSSWESGRTQPDIETLMKLSELFSVTAEELIYGKSKTMSAEEKDNSSRQKLIIIFSVLGSLLTVIGLVLILVTYWDRFPFAVQSVFSFIPMLAGQGVAVYTFLKYRDSIAWKESASVLWCAGVSATIALMDSINAMYTDFADCLFIDILLTLPVLFILDAVTPLLFIHFGVNYLLIDNLNRTNSFLLTNIIILSIFAVALSYVLINRKNRDEARHIFSQWISLISFTVIFIADVCFAKLNEPDVLILITAYFVSLFILSCDKALTSPANAFGIFGALALSVTDVILYHPYMMSAPLNGYKADEKLNLIICAVICVITVTVLSIFKRKELSKKKITLGLFIPAVILILSEALCCIIAPEENNIIFWFITLFSSFAFAFAVTAKGIVSDNFVFVNIGLVATAANLIFILWDMITEYTLAAGILLLIFGVSLFAVNFLLAKKIKKTKEENDNA